MPVAELETTNLKLVPLTREEVRAEVEHMPAEEKAQLSPGWLELLENSSLLDPWIHGFILVHRDTHTIVGRCGFKGPPRAGVVEIAYGIASEHRGRGYATEAADALATYAFRSGKVHIVRAHTLPQVSASTRVLSKCRFERVAEVIDSEDGLVWRWEKTATLPRFGLLRSVTGATRPAEAQGRDQSGRPQ